MTLWQAPKFPGRPQAIKTIKRRFDRRYYKLTNVCNVALASLSPPHRQVAIDPLVPGHTKNFQFDQTSPKTSPFPTKDPPFCFAPDEEICMKLMMQAGHYNHDS